MYFSEFFDQIKKNNEHNENLRVLQEVAQVMNVSLSRTADGELSGKCADGEYRVLSLRWDNEEPLLSVRYFRDNTEDFYMNSYNGSCPLEGAFNVFCELV